LVLLEYVNALSFENFNDFASFVFAAMRAGAVSPDFFVTVGTFGKLGDAQSIMGPASGCPALGMAAFWIRHSSVSLVSQFI
jgi:hypothetical protein